MFNPDYPTTSYGWNAFTYQPYDQQQVGSVYYNGQGSPNPFANPVTPSDSRRQIGQNFATNWNGQPPQQQPQQPAYGYASPYAPQQPVNPATTVAQAPNSYNGPSMLSPNAFASPTNFGGSPDASFDCIYNNQYTAWDKSSSAPAWNNYYTQERQVPPPPIDWTASQRPAQQNTFANGYSISNINPAASTQVTFANPNEDWMATTKQNFSNL